MRTSKMVGNFSHERSNDSVIHAETNSIDPSLKTFDKDVIVNRQKRLSVHEAAQYTGMSVDTIRTLCQQGQIPFYRSGQAGSKNGKILFRIETLDRWMEQQERANCPGWE